MQRRVLSYVGSVVLAALLLVPLVLRGHHHGPENAAARSCAACVVAQHTPVLHAPPAGPEAPALRTAFVPRVAPRVAARDGASPAHGRSPPRVTSRVA